MPHSVSKRTLPNSKPYPNTQVKQTIRSKIGDRISWVVGPRLIDGRGFWGVLGGADNVLGYPPYKIFSWTCCYAIHSSLAWGVLGGSDNVLGCLPYKIFSWTCCYAIHSSLAPYPGTRYQLLLVTCKTLLIFALLFLGGVLGGADNVLGCPPYEINGHHKMSQGVHSMIQQWMWRQTILPCSPKELMSCLVDLLKKYHDFK